jgi:hypothetical protein
MDNEQGKTDLIWLTGLIDGEGYLSAIPGKRKGYDNLYFVPVVKIGMCHFPTIEHIHNIFDRHQIGHFIEDRAKKGNWSASKCINVKGWKRVKNFCGLMAGMPWVTKKEDFDNLYKLVNCRTSHFYKDPYTDTELSLIEKLRNKRKSTD